MKKILGFMMVLALVIISCSSGETSLAASSGYSSDYFGLEAGWQLNYRDVIKKGGTTTTANIQISVAEETTKNGSVIFKKLFSDGQTLGYYYEYYSKLDNGYYYNGCRGEGESDEMEESPVLVMTNPITMGLKDLMWGSVTGQETVTVAAGTFSAWVFERKLLTNSDNYTYSRCYKYWFVPYLGMVKFYLIETENGRTCMEETSELISFTK